MRSEFYFGCFFDLLNGIVETAFSFVLFLSLLCVLEVSLSLVVFLQRKASAHLEVSCSFGDFIFFLVIIFGEEQIGLDLDFVIEMESMFLFDVLGESLLVVEKMVGEEILFAESLSFDFLFVFEDLVDGGGFGVGGLIKFIHKNIVSFILSLRSLSKYSLSMN